MSFSSVPAGFLQSPNNFVRTANTSPSALSQLSSRLSPNGAPTGWCHNVRQQIEAATVQPCSRDIVRIETAPQFVLAEFECSFLRHLGTEYFFYEDLSVTTNLKDVFPVSHARPVVLLKASANLELPDCVALFPENWKHQSANLEEEDVFFFMDKFVDRFRKYSLPIIRRTKTGESFPALLAAFAKGDNADLCRQLCTDWMWLHEPAHRDAVIPYATINGVDLRQFKFSRHAGGCEEMRADVNGICRLLDVQNGQLSSSYRDLLVEFILFERLIRYPVQFLCTAASGTPVNYDSVGSQMLFNHLKQYCCVATDGPNLYLADCWQDGLRLFRDRINAVEADVLADAVSESTDQISDPANKTAPANGHRGHPSSNDARAHRRIPRRPSPRLSSTKALTAILTPAAMIKGRRRLDEFAKELAGFNQSIEDYEFHPFFHAAAMRPNPL